MWWWAQGVGVVGEDNREAVGTASREEVDLALPLLELPRWAGAPVGELASMGPAIAPLGPMERVDGEVGPVPIAAEPNLGAHPVVRGVAGLVPLEWEALPRATAREQLAEPAPRFP